MCLVFWTYQDQNYLLTKGIFMKLYSSFSETVIQLGFVLIHNGGAIRSGDDRSQFRHNLLKLPK